MSDHISTPRVKNFVTQSTKYALNRLRKELYLQIQNAPEGAFQLKGGLNLLLATCSRVATFLERCLIV